MSTGREQPFMKALMVALGARSDMRVWRTNTGTVEVFKRGRIVGTFSAGPPPGKADLSAIVAPEGWVLEIETKGEDTETLEAQEHWAAMIRSKGGIYVRVRSDSAISMDLNVANAVNAIEHAIFAKRAACKAKT